MNVPLRAEDASSTGGQGSTQDGVLMHPDLAANWTLWSGVVSQAALTLLSTADGLHIASVGALGETGDRLAAMNGSLFAVARAEAEIISRGTEPSLSAVVSVSIGQSQLSLLSFILAPYGQLLLSVSAKGVQVGTVIVQARSAAYELITALGLAGAPG